MDWLATLSSDQKLTVAIAFFSAVLGGLISLATSFALAVWQFREQRSSIAKEKIENQAILAQHAFIKLLEYANLVYSLKIHIDDQFDSAAAAGDEQLEPAHKVQQIVHAEIPMERFSAQEIAFLMRTKDSNLLQDILIFEKRALSHGNTVSTYNLRRSELEAKFTEGMVSQAEEGGTSLNVVLRGQHAVVANMHIAVLNNLLGQFMEKLERDSKDGAALLDRYSRVAKTTFGNQFPTIALEK